MEWSHIGLAAAEWRQPGHLTKNREPHRLHLNALALEVLHARWQTNVEVKADGDAEVLARPVWQPERRSPV